MAVTESIYTGNGSTTNYSFTFPYLKTSDIKTSINGTVSTAFTLANATTVQFNTAPANSATVRIYRETDDSDLQATFYAGSAIKSSDLNDNFNQTLYVTQESNNKIDTAWTTGDETITSSETWVSNDSRVSTTAAQDARIDSKIDTALTTDVAAGNKITVTDNSPGSGQITVGVTSGSLVDSDINASAAIAGTKITPNFGSQNIVTSGTVDGRNVSTDGTKLDGIEAGATADQTAAEIRVLVENASDSNVFTDADHSKLNTIEASATADQTSSEIKTLLQSDKLTISEMDTTSLDGRYYTESEADARFYNLASTEEIQSGETWVAADDKIATTSAIDNRIIDLLDDVGGFVPIANETSFPNANPDINNGAGTLLSVPLANNLTSNGSGVITISNGTVGNSTVTINGAGDTKTYAQGFGIIVETTSTLNTYTFHRYVPKATEVTTVAGNTTNINTVAGNNSNISTVAGISSNVTTVAGISSDVTTVANDGSDIGTVAGAIANVNNVGNNISNVNAVATNATNINAVQGNATNINTVAGISSNVTTVAGDTTAINNITTNLSAVQGAATNATNAASSATAAAASESTASTQATNAAASATTASTQATNAATSATTATTQATTATTQATTATTQATNAATSATNAAASEAQAKTYRDEFNSIYLGSKANNPALDNLGAPVTAGDIYQNSTEDKVKVFNGQTWDQITAEPAPIFTSTSSINQGIFDAYAVIRDEKEHDVHGGSASANTWHTRDLNTEYIDPKGLIVGFNGQAIDTGTPKLNGGQYTTETNANQFALAAGTYLIKAGIPAFSIGAMMGEISQSDTKDGTFSNIARAHQYEWSTDNNYVYVQQRVVLTSTKFFHIKLFTGSSRSTYGLGVKFDNTTDYGNIHYTVVEIFRESSGTITPTKGFQLVYTASAGSNNIDLGTLTGTSSGLTEENISTGRLVSLAEGPGTTTYDLSTL